jgi:hypothetical protein
VVARLGSTARDQIYQVREIFERGKLRVVGAVAFEAKRSSLYGRKRYGYGYGYGYGHESESDTETVPRPPVPRPPVPRPPRLPAR